MKIKRLLILEEILAKKSCFLLGPRQSGKSWLIRNTLPSCPVIDLLSHQQFVRLSRNPERLRDNCVDGQSVVIYEIQKLPVLLDEVHRLIEERGVRFLLTGSSARKLRRGGVNLLGGRAWVRNIHPFSAQELKTHFDLDRAINFGLLPSVYLSDTPEEDLRAYAGSYLQEEIVAEGVTRNIPAFSRFLEVAAACNGKLINYAKISNDAQVARTTVQEYFQVLKDTLIAHELPAWGKTIKRKAVGTSKLYLFDPGVARVLQNRRAIDPGSPEFGGAFEHWVFHELKCYIDYMGKRVGLAFWRSLSGYEVDFILNDEIAIEVKASENVDDRDMKGLRALKEERLLKHCIVVSREKHIRKVGGITILPWGDFITALWQNRLQDV
jgi:predicted AAA+ superfamily ATPase